MTNDELQPCTWYTEIGSETDHFVLALATTCMPLWAGPVVVFTDAAHDAVHVMTRKRFMNEFCLSSVYAAK